MDNKNILDFINHLLKFQENPDDDKKQVIKDFMELGFSEVEIKENLELIKCLKKNYIQALLKEVKESIPKKTKKSKKLKESSETKKLIDVYTKEGIYLDFGQNDECIMKKFKANDLKNMYETLYNKKPRSKMKKQDLINSIRAMIRSESRGEAFNK